MTDQDGNVHGIYHCSSNPDDHTICANIPTRYAVVDACCIAHHENRDGVRHPFP